MVATNGIGYDIQVYQEATGWLVENTKPFITHREATLALIAVPKDGRTRRVYEALSLPTGITKRKSR